MCDTSPALANPEDLVDDETRESFANIQATQAFIANSEEDVRILLLQQAEICDFLERADELAKNEYFDITYFTSETRKVWGEREDEDMNGSSADKPFAVRLFPNKGDKEKQVRLKEKLREDHALEDRDELKRRHPLLFNRVVRDESRRLMFKEALEARRQYSALVEHSIASGSHLPLLTASATHALKQDSCSSTILNATKGTHSTKPFGSLPDYVRVEVQRAAEAKEPTKDWKQAVAESMSAAEKVVEKVTRPEGPSIATMLADQRKQLTALAEREETQYRPLLASYFAYDAAVRAKLDKLAS